MQQSIQFRLYPESIHGFYFECVIYPSQKLFRKACHSRNGHDPGDDCRAVVQPSRTYRNGRLTKRLGYINFVNTDLSAEVLSHESVHAALRWAEAMRIDVKDYDGKGLAMDAECGEERFAYAVGRICAQISDAVWQNGLIDI